jgi:hypothetical protein
MKILKLTMGVSFFVLLCLSSCATKRIEEKIFSPVYVTNTLKYVILAPDTIEKPLDMAQQITAFFGDQEWVMNSWVQADKEGIAIVLFDTLGSGLGDLSYRAGALSFSSSIFPPSFKAEYLVADFQFCFYRIDALKAALGRLKLDVEIHDGLYGSKEIRRIRDGKKVIIEIEKSPEVGVLKYTNFLRGYGYTLRGDFGSDAPGRSGCFSALPA